MIITYQISIDWVPGRGGPHLFVRHRGSGILSAAPLRSEREREKNTVTIGKHGTQHGIYIIFLCYDRQAFDFNYNSGLQVAQTMAQS